MHRLHGSPLYNFREWGLYYPNTYLSSISSPNAKVCTNLMLRHITFTKLGYVKCLRYVNCLIQIFINIYENIRNEKKIVEILKWGGGNNSVVKYPRVPNLAPKQCLDLVLLPFGWI